MKFNYYFAKTILFSLIILFLCTSNVIASKIIFNKYEINKLKEIIPKECQNVSLMICHEEKNYLQKDKFFINTIKENDYSKFDLDLINISTNYTSRNVLGDTWDVNLGYYENNSVFWKKITVTTNDTNANNSYIEMSIRRVVERVILEDRNKSKSLLPQNITLEETCLDPEEYLYSQGLEQLYSRGILINVFLDDKNNVSTHNITEYIISNGTNNYYLKIDNVSPKIIEMYLDIINVNDWNNWGNTSFIICSGTLKKLMVDKDNNKYWDNILIKEPKGFINIETIKISLIDIGIGFSFTVLTVVTFVVELRKSKYGKKSKKKKTIMKNQKSLKKK